MTSAIAGIATKIQSLMLREVRAIPPSASATVAVNSERPSRMELLGTLAEHGRSPRPAHRKRSQHQQLGAECENAPLLVPVGRVPGPEEVADPPTTKAVATVSLVITVRRYRCSHSLAGSLIDPFARRPRADGKGSTNPPAAQNPPGPQWFDVFAQHCSSPPGGPRPRTLPPLGAPAPRRAVLPPRKAPALRASHPGHFSTTGTTRPDISRVASRQD